MSASMCAARVEPCLTPSGPSFLETYDTMRSAAPAETSGRPFHSAPQCPGFDRFAGGQTRCRRSAKLTPNADSRSSRGSPDSSDLARMETAVPMDQRPATQLKELRDSQLYSWVRFIDVYTALPTCSYSVSLREQLLLSSDSVAGHSGEERVLEASRGSFHWILLPAGWPNSIPNVRSPRTGITHLYKLVLCSVLCERHFCKQVPKYLLMHETEVKCLWCADSRIPTQWCPWGWICCVSCCHPHLPGLELCGRPALVCSGRL